MTDNAAIVTPKPGFYQGVDFDTYASWAAANASTLKGFARTPAHVEHERQTGGKQTKAKELGWLLHLSVFEPERFASEVVVAPEIARRTKKGRAIWASFEAEHPGAYIVDVDTRSRISGMAKALASHPTASEFLSGDGFNELSIVWKERETRMLCKARIDRVANINDWPTVGDAKSAEDASRPAFERSVARFGYHVSAAHYLDGLETLKPVPSGNPFRRFMWLAVESSPPHCAAVYEISDEALAQGLEDRNRYLRKWKECTESGEWPGYPDGVEYAGLPAWAYRRYEDFND